MNVIVCSQNTKSEILFIHSIAVQVTLFFPH